MEYKLISPPSWGASITEQVFLNRGFKSKEDIYHYLHTNDDDILDPLLLRNMRAGAELLVQHIKQQSKVKIIVDPDCDGFTSAAALINYLNYLFPYFVQHNISYALHDDKSHGLIMDAIGDDINLVIAPDSSSNEQDLHKELTERGIEVLVLDHHNADECSQYACVINNHTCDYPNKSLSGVGIVYKFCQYIDSLLGINESDKILDLVALGGIADMMDLRTFETRRLIEKGLANPQNPFIRAMVAKNEYSLKGQLTPMGVAFYIAPSVNAVSRVGTMADKLLLFESLLEYKAFDYLPSTKRGHKPGERESRVEQSCRTCGNLKNRQNRKRDEALEKIEAYIEKNSLHLNKLLLICLPEKLGVAPTLTGLVANALANKYQKPTVLLNAYEDECGELIWKGSGRNYSGTDFSNLQAFLQESGKVALAQGHDDALGVHIYDSEIQSLREYAEEKLKDFNFQPLYRTDFIFQGENINPQDILQVASLSSYWGQELPEPWVAVENLRVFPNNLALLKGNTIKISTDNNLSFIMFKQDEEVFGELFSEYGYVTINLIGRCRCNSWDGSAQIEVTEFEIVGRSELYF